MVGYHFLGGGSQFFLNFHPENWGNVLVKFRNDGKINRLPSRIWFQGFLGDAGYVFFFPKKDEARLVSEQETMGMIGMFWFREILESPRINEHEGNVERVNLPVEFQTTNSKALNNRLEL